MNRIDNMRMNEKSDHQKEFGKKILSIVPHLHPYVKHRLYIAENTGILPQNMYCSNGIIDDAIVKLYTDEELDIDMNTLSLELILFKVTDHLIDLLYINEGWHKQSISTSYFLEQELNKLEEKYTLTADNSTVFNNDLNDISYHQPNENKEYFIYEDLNSTLFDVIKHDNFSENKKQRLLGKFYTWLPMETSKIIDLFVFGKLNFDEISIITDISPYEIKKTIIEVRRSFRVNLI